MVVLVLVNVVVVVVAPVDSRRGFSRRLVVSVLGMVDVRRQRRRWVMGLVRGVLSLGRSPVRLVVVVTAVANDAKELILYGVRVHPDQRVIDPVDARHFS